MHRELLHRDARISKGTAPTLSNVLVLKQCNCQQTQVLSTSDESAMKNEPVSCRILIVDNSALMLRAMVQLFQPYGFELLTASTADEALRLSVEFQPHAIYVGLTPDNNDCCELPRRLRLVYGLRQTMCAGLIRPEDKSRRTRPLQKGGFDYFLSRTPTMSEIVAKLTAIDR